MRKLYNEFFYVSEGENVRDKVILTRVVVMVTTVIVCLAAMSFSAYAYFSYNITSDSQIVKAARFEADVLIHITDDYGEALVVDTTTNDHQTHKVVLEAGKVYTVTIMPTENSTAKTGFMVVTAKGCGETYHTQQLGVDTGKSSGMTGSVTFRLMVTDQSEVCLLAHWGTSSYYDRYKNTADEEGLYITEGEEIKMIVNGYKEPNVSGNSTSGGGDEQGEQPSAPDETPEA